MIKLIALVVTLFVFVSTASPSLAQTADPSALASNLTAAVNARDASAISGLFTAEGTVTFAIQGNPTERITVQEWGNRLATASSNEIPADLRMAVVGSPQLAGDRVAWTWRQTASFIREFGVDYFDYTVEATVAEDKFSAFTISPTAETLAAAPFGGGVTGGVGMPRTGETSLAWGLLLIAIVAVLLAGAGLRLRSANMR